MAAIPENLVYYTIDPNFWNQCNRHLHDLLSVFKGEIPS